MFTATITSALNKELMEKVQFSPINQEVRPFYGILMTCYGILMTLYEILMTLYGILMTFYRTVMTLCPPYGAMNNFDSFFLKKNLSTVV